MTRTVFTLLGTGSSGGVPRVDGDWGACDPEEPRNYRTRCCAMVEKHDASGNVTRALIDTSPDLRAQLLREKVQTLDAIVFTHDHADQVHGIDDVRPFFINRREPIPTFMNAQTRESLVSRFGYCFAGSGGYPAILDAQSDLEAFQSFHILGSAGPIEMLPVNLVHGHIRCLGYRIGDLAYCNDVNAIPDDSMEQLYGLETLVVDALRYTPHPSHAHLELALRWIETLKPRHAVLTNLHVDMDYKTLQSELPGHIAPAYDGMRLTIGSDTK